MLSFTLLGLAASSTGAILPLLRTHYSLSDLHVSLIFLAGPLGYLLGAQSSSTLHTRLGQRGVAVLGPLFLVLGTGLVAAHRGFGLVLTGFAALGVGTGVLDGSWCAWAGSMERANVVSGALHGAYSVGGAGGPFLVVVVTGEGGEWWVWYYVLTALSIIVLVVLTYAFRAQTAAVYLSSKQAAQTDDKNNTREMLRHPATWLCAAYFLTYVGTETAISGWVVSFMLRQRHASPYIAGLSSSGYWTGMAIGRLMLGFATDRIGVRRATVLYFLLAVLLEALFAIFTSPVLSIILMALLGFVMGPLFPSGVVVLTRLLPPEIHVAAVSFVASLGQVGGAFLPFAIGAVVEGLGIGVFRYAILLQTVLALGVWVAFARLRGEGRGSGLRAVD
ncbi:MFS general substrate transporter [Pyrenochaeta sp. DS3sAY3a]|nr:MFS general substrate transporter [Pyrenochaeta sp. DS3sAY3a]